MDSEISDNNALITGIYQYLCFETDKNQPFYRSKCMKDAEYMARAYLHAQKIDAALAVFGVQKIQTEFSELWGKHEEDTRYMPLVTSLTYIYEKEKEETVRFSYPVTQTTPLTLHKSFAEKLTKEERLSIMEAINAPFDVVPEEVNLQKYLFITEMGGKLEFFIRALFLQTKRLWMFLKKPFPRPSLP